MHTGDWKLDLTPVDGRLTDLARMGGISYEHGVRLLLGDSTNADAHGHSRSEKSVGGALYDLFHEHEGRRIVIACFASHVHRVQQIADAAIAFGRKVATLGLSMKKNMKLAREMGLLQIPESSLVDIEDIGKYPAGDVCVISTGSQGEPMSALTRMANSENRWLTIGDGDTVILSSHPIPGNEMSVTKVIDGLVRLGAKVVHSGIEDVHATGHAKQEELKTLLSIVEPQWFVPVHGEYRHLVHHQELAQRMGVPPERTLLCLDGDQITIDDAGIRKSGSVPAGYLYVDGIVGDVGQGVLRDRRVLAEEGVVVVVVGVALEDGAILTGPEIITRGWVYAPEAEALLDECADVVRQALKDVFAEAKTPDVDALQRAVRRAAGRFVNDRTKRKPMIVPVVMEA
jgi:ribonuclease J